MEGATGLVAPDASTLNPLEALGLGVPDVNEAAGLLAQIGQLPGAAEVQTQANAAAAAQFAQSQGIQVIPQVNAPAPAGAPAATPGVDPMVEFNAAIAAQAVQEQQAADAAQAGQGPQVAQGPEGEQPITLTKDDYDFLVGMITDQGTALQGYIGGQAPAPGPASVSAVPMVAPTAPMAPAAPQGVAPIAVPAVAETEISEADFASMTTDRAAMSKYLHQRDMNMAATVTEHLSATVLPHIYTHMQGQMDEQTTINNFLQTNPDLAEHPQALQAAVAEARVALPYAKADRLMYYASQKLRGAMRANANINTSVHDLRGAIAGRRAPVTNNAQPLRRGPGNAAAVNPFDVMKAEMKAHAANTNGDILKTLGIG